MLEAGALGVGGFEVLWGFDGLTAERWGNGNGKELRFGGVLESTILQGVDDRIAFLVAWVRKLVMLLAVEMGCEIV